MKVIPFRILTYYIALHGSVNPGGSLSGRKDYGVVSISGDLVTRILGSEFELGCFLVSWGSALPLSVRQGSGYCSIDMFVKAYRLGTGKISLQPLKLRV
jgi:hypothetical protein